MSDILIRVNVLKQPCPNQFPIHALLLLRTEDNIFILLDPQVLSCERQQMKATHLQLRDMKPEDQTLRRQPEWGCHKSSQQLQWNQWR